MMELPEQQESTPSDEGLLARIKAAISSLNPFAKLADAMETPEQKASKAPKSPDGLLTGRSSDVFNENVRILRSRGVSEADAVRIARERMMGKF